MPRPPRPTAALVAVVAALLPLLWAAPPAAAQGSRCTFPAEVYKGRPWSLQRVNPEELWKAAGTKGAGVRIAVIDTGVDASHPQLRAAVDRTAGAKFLKGGAEKTAEKGTPPSRTAQLGAKNGTTDFVGHGTKIAGIIAARPADGTGFVGLAPEATIVPIIQNDENGSGTSDTLAEAIVYAVDRAKVQIINISQDTATALRADSALEQAVEYALRRNVLVIASAGNDGLGGAVKETYPAAYPGVLAVAASDRTNERASFSQSGAFVGVAAPGVDMVSTVPKGGHCSDNGTSFSAPYAAGVAALLRAKHADWTARQITARLQQTAQRTIRGRDRLVGWGVVDPVRALSGDAEPIDAPYEDHTTLSRAQLPTPARLPAGETEEQRTERLATYALVAAAALLALTAGAARVHRDRARRRGDAASR
ncbi:type VII secretion-associated serine protease mycosin [Streptomyces polyrhachis]|uniref:Type VII secretion-associated serine protease mycosin n=1 Tax=Streptomyces polyrhachis TaxID=1282885 RepID=A0ABW2GC04_9ACTN